MGTSLVLELQRDAMGSVMPLTELLRKATVVARKLGIKEFQGWINSEIYGYKQGETVPEYRRVNGQISVWNPYHGWQPVIISDTETAKILSSRAVMQPISELEKLLSIGKGELVMHFPPDVQRNLMDWTGAPLPPVLRVDKSQIHGVIDATRSTVLDWTLKLEEDGILGENMSFSDEEKKKAQANSGIYIQNFQGILGNVTQSSVSQDFRVIHNDWESLEKYLLSIGAVKEDVSALKSAIKQDGVINQQGKFGKSVSEWMGKMVSKAASGIWSVSTSAAANLLAKALATYYGMA